MDILQNVKKSDGDSLMLKTVLQYLSNIKMHLKKSDEYKNAEAWLNEEWYTTLYNETGKNITYRSIQLGIPITEKSRRIGRKMLLLICKQLLTENSVTSIEAWAVILTTFLANGRTGEISKTVWNENTYYHVEHESLFMDWSQSKTSKVKQMTFCPDKDHPELDFYLCWATYFVIGGSQRYRESKWIFPFIADLKQPNRKINDYLGKLRLKIDVLTEEYQGTALRIGATNHLANHPGITFEQLVTFGGWDMSSISACFHYILQLEEPILKCSRALTGWDPRYPVFPPRLTDSSLSKVDSVLFQNFKNSLFAEMIPIIKKPNLPFIDHLMASILLNLDYMKKHYPENVLYQKVFAEASKFKIPVSALKKMGALIRVDYEARNSQIQGVGNEVVQRVLGVLIDKFDIIDKRLDCIDETVSCALLPENRKYSESSETSKKRKISELEEEEDDEEEANNESGLVHDEAALANNQVRVVMDDKTPIYELFLNNHFSSVSMASVKDERVLPKARAVLSMMFNSMNTEEKEFINSPKVKRNEAGFTHYDQKIRMISNRLSNELMTFLSIEEDKLDQGKNKKSKGGRKPAATIGAVSRRMTELKIVVKPMNDNTQQPTLKNFFSKASSSSSSSS
jgi:hypothetical protein